MSAEGRLDLGWRLARAVETLAYIGVSIVLGLAGTAVVAAVATGAALSVLWVGLPLVLVAMAAARWLAEVERRQVNRLLDAGIPPLPLRPARGGSLWRRVVEAVSDGWQWRVLGLLALRLPLATLSLAAAVVPILAAGHLLALGVSGIGGLHEDVVYVGPFALDALIGVVLVALAVPALVVGLAVLGGLRAVLAAVSRVVLSPRGAEGPVRELLAASLGDRSVNVAYWLEDRGAFVDEAGRPVTLPGQGSGRAWTAVDDAAGRRVAAIVHDAALDAGPELVQAAAAGAALAIDNERLKADLRARVEELRVSRLRVVEAALTARQRIERDLHDGAQQHLVALAIEMGMLKSRLKGSDDLPLVEGMAEKLQTALAELRELARGIHPAILTDRGLAAALDALAARSPMPVETHVALDGERLPRSVEVAVYFVAAEALTNVAKYAEATHAGVHIARTADEVTVRVTDDGVGGATTERGTGLLGLVDRLGALDGRLQVDSPPGAGTRIVATIPLAAAVEAPAPEEATP